MKFYKLNVNQSIFWDPTQPKEENQKLVSNWCLPLEETDSMMSAKRNERIVLAEPEEVAAYYKEIGKDIPKEEDEAEATKEGSKPASKPDAKK